MSKKNSNVILKNVFKESYKLTEIFLNFKNKLNNLKTKSYLVAISGGPDSLALASLCKAYSYDYRCKFHYVLVNHNIRKNSLKEAKIVKKILKDKKINLTVLSNQVPIKKNIQSTARNIRYKMLLEYCKKKGVKKIITAHNLEDQVETFFIRLSRGSGLTGLSAMKPLTNLKHNVKLYRPLLDTKKKFLIEISKKTFGSFIKDPSNKNKKYLRTKIRSLKEPLKQSGINYDQIINSINNLASSKETLDSLLIKASKETTRKFKGNIFINLSKFNDYNKEFKLRLINQSIKMIKKNYYNPRSKKVARLIEMLNRPNFKKYTLGGCIFLREKDQICVKSEKK